MIKIKEYVMAESLEQAYELNQKKRNCIIGGMLWLKMGNRMVPTAIDLSNLGLNTIEENEEEFSIGCMTTLRQLEQHEGLNSYTNGAVSESVRSIVGVQFRNLATVGGSIFGRFGFSDVLTCFLALDTWVETVQRRLHPPCRICQAKTGPGYSGAPVVKKHEDKSVYLSHRNSKTDFPVLTCGISVTGGTDLYGSRCPSVESSLSVCVRG